MKRLMYTQLAYDSAYFAFEGGLTSATNASAISPIGTLQAQAMQFFARHGGSGPTGLGVHVPTIAVLLDAAGGWTRPCDTRPQKYTAAAWGNVPWDAADFLADAVLDELFPGYRAGSLLRNESGTMAPTPYGDAADVLLSDAILPVLQQYDTVVVAHRTTTDAADVLGRLLAYATAGGRVVLTASSLADLASQSSVGGTSVAGVVVLPCSQQPAGTVVKLVGSGAAVTEPLAFVACPLQAAAAPPPASWEVLATFAGGQIAAARVAVGNGSLTVIGAGNYGITAATVGDLYGCGADEPDSRTAQPFQLAQFARALLASAMANAATFDLGSDLAWVPKRVSDGVYVLTVTNPGLVQLPLAIASPMGPVAAVLELATDQSEKSAVGYLPDGFAGVNVGVSTPTSIAGGDTRVFRVLLSADSSSLIPGGGDSGPDPPPAAPEWAWVSRRLLRLQAGGADIKRQLQLRPGFLAAFGGVLVDWEYLSARSPAALAEEARWLAMRRVAVVVDFSSGTTLFPGLRLCDDMGGYFQQSLAAINDVLGKMTALGASDALFALHGTSELPPANFSGGAPAYAASVNATLSALSSAAAAQGVRLHLRRSARNDDLAGTSLGANAAFAASAGLLMAPSLAYVAARGDSASAIAALLASGQGTVLLLSAAWVAPDGRMVESAPLVQLPPASAPALQVVHAAAVAAGSWVVLDAGYDTNEASGRAQELADVGFLLNLVGSGVGGGVGSEVDALVD
jgi:hypothetical protein